MRRDINDPHVNCDGVPRRTCRGVLRITLGVAALLLTILLVDSLVRGLTFEHVVYTFIIYGYMFILLLWGFGEIFAFTLYVNVEPINPRESFEMYRAYNGIMVHEPTR